MKISITITLLFFLLGFKSKQNSDFIIIIKEGYVINRSTGKSYEIFDQLKGKEVLIIKENAMLVIVDEFSNYYEFNGIDTINLKNINCIGLAKTKLPYDFLYANNYTLSTNDSFYPVSVYIPYNAYNGIYAKDSIRIKWIDNSFQKNYNLLGIDISGDTIINEFTKEKEFNIPSISRDFLKISIQDSLHNQLSLDYALFSNKVKKPYKINSAVDYVMIGLYLESIGQFRLAHTYYKMALKADDRNSIKTIYEYHLKRYKTIEDKLE